MNDSINPRRRAARAGRLLACSIAVPLLAAGTAVAQSWEKITATESQYSVVVNGEHREVAPGCITGGATGDARYSFYFKRGNLGKLVVFFNGGGACWNGATCIAGAQGPQPLYVPTADTLFNHPAAWGGLLNTDAEDNPYRDWSMAFLPYCTADVHIGSKTTLYQFGGASVPITHRGFDNFLFARDWIERNSPKVEKLLVAGSSAGAYGAALNYGHLREAFPAAAAYLIGDGGSGVVTSAFVASALDQSWGGGANLPAALQPLRNQPSEYFLPAAYGLLTFRYPKDLFSQYTTAWDGVQTLIYNVMLHQDTPEAWFTTLGGAVVPWHVTMRTFAYTNAAAGNYRHFIANGCEHTILRIEDSFYSDAKVGKTSFLDWLSAQTHPNARSPRPQWTNRDACGEPGGCPPPSVPQLIACAAQPG